MRSNSAISSPSLSSVIGARGSNLKHFNLENMSGQWSHLTCDDHLLFADRLLPPPLLLSVRFSLAVFQLVHLPALQIILSDGVHQC